MFDKPKGKSARHFIHGLSHTRIDNIYKSMVSRCYKPNNNRYSIYGGRGIKVCDEWLKNKKAFFIWAFENGYSENLTIDRIDPDGDYEPSNCRWSTQKEQQNNRHNTIHVQINGSTFTLSELSDITGMKRGTLWIHCKKGDIEKYVGGLNGNLRSDSNA